MKSLLIALLVSGLLITQSSGGETETPLAEKADLKVITAKRAEELLADKKDSIRESHVQGYVVVSDENAVHRNSVHASKSRFDNILEVNSSSVETISFSDCRFDSAVYIGKAGEDMPNLKEIEFIGCSFPTRSGFIVINCPLNDDITLVFLNKETGGVPYIMVKDRASADRLHLATPTTPIVFGKTLSED